MAQPVLENMARGELQKNMQTEFSPSFDNRNRKVVYMETFGRLMAGIAPWLALPDTLPANATDADKKELRSLKAEGLFPYKCPRECTLSKSYMTTRTDWYGKLFDFLYLRLNTRLGFGWMRCLLRLRQMGK